MLLWKRDPWLCLVFRVSLMEVSDMVSVGIDDILTMHFNINSIKKNTCIAEASVFKK